MSEHELIIKSSELDAGGKDYRFELRSAWIRGILEEHEATASTQNGTLEVRASKSGQDVVVAGTLDARLNVPCARCLEPFDLDIHADLAVIYVPGSKAPSAKGHEGDGEPEYTLEDAEADTLPYDGETVVLDDLVRDELILGVPMIPLCSEGCPGMSPAPGQGTGADRGPGEKAIDPRLAPLLDFQAKARGKTTKT